jgi:hypothetical protein
VATLDLRPLSLGELLDRTFFLYRRNFLLFIGISAAPYLILMFAGLAPVLLAGLARGSRAPSAAQAIGMAGVGIVALLAFLAFFVALLFSMGATVFAVAEFYSGRRPTIRGCLRMVRGHAGTVFGVMLLSGLIAGVGFIALIVPGVYLLCRLPAATPAALIENLGPADAIRRSFDLTKDFAGRAFMIILLTLSMTWAVAALFQLPFYVLIAVTAKQPQLVLIWTVLAQVGSAIGSVLVAPVSTISTALFYYDLRVRKEAFDLQMMMQAVGADPAPPPVTGGIPSMFGRDAF